MKKSALLVLLTLLVLAVLPMPVLSESELVNIPLEWKPTDAVSEAGAIDLTVFKGVSFIVKPFGDARKDPAEIGKNIERRFSDKDLPVTTKDDVAAWLTKRVSDILSEFDIDVVESGGTYNLEADIVKFYVTEESLYRAEVALKVRLKSPAGATVWEGLTSGRATRFGRSYQAENYFEGLSNATISAVHGLLTNQSFLRAVQKGK